MNDNLIYQRQLEREETSESVGKQKFFEDYDYNNKTGNASNNDFGLFVKQHLLGAIVLKVKELTQRTLGSKGNELPDILRKCLKATPDGTTTDFFDCEKVALIAIQKTLDTALNPNKLDRKVQGKVGTDKRLLEKKTLTQLEHQIGVATQNQISLTFIQKTFPAWFRKAKANAEKPNEGGMRASTFYFDFRMEQAMNSYAEWLRENNRTNEAELLESRRCWTYRECSVIGALLMKAVLDVCNDYITIVDGTRAKNGKLRKTKEIVLTDKGREKEQGITEFVSQFAHDLLPMLVEPNPITNEKLGGWIGETLQDKSQKHTGSIHLSDKHLEFINRQARVKFQLNPFIQQLINTLYERKLSLGKFLVNKITEPESVATRLGIGGIRTPEQDKEVRSHPDFKQVKRNVAIERDLNNQKRKENQLASIIIDKANKIKDDPHNHYPMDYDFRGRIYSRVPFISFQSSDAGRFLIRFAERTPIDSRTKFWLKIGIANAGGADKLCWDDRERWFDNHYDEIVNVARMFDGGDFDKAYEFLSSVEEPFCLASLADEFVKIFVDKTQDYTQTFVFVDCSCSGTSIFNAWRLNAHGAKMTNLIDTDEPTDIYLEVWEEMKRLAPDNHFNERRIKRLEKSKLLRKMMKTTYVPASYASPRSEQHKHLRNFNKTKLKKEGLAFNDKEMDLLCELWDVALDKVSSINSVVSWFQARVKDALNSGKNSITYTTANGSVMTLNYPKSRLKQVRTFHYGSAIYRKVWEEETLPEVDKRKMMIAITANITHATDASALCEALWDCETPFSALHDAVGMPPSKLMDKGITRLKLGLIDACRHSVWDTFRTDNGLPLDARTAPPIIGDLDLEEIIFSNYLFS